MVQTKKTTAVANDTLAAEPAVTGVTAPEFKKAAAAYVKHSQLGEEVSAEMKRELAAVNQLFEPRLEKHAKAMLAAREVIEQYARENRKLFSDKKTVEMHGITFGFKMGSPKVLLGTVVEETTEAVKAAWEKALQQLKKYLPDYVKTQEEIAKAKLLTDKKVIDPKVLAKCGLKIDSDETFILQRNP